MVRRVHYLGFEIRVELELAEGGSVVVQITRRELAELELREGDVVWARPDAIGPAESPPAGAGSAASR